IMDSSLADPAADGWQRTGIGECQFCEMLISRGAVYSASTADFAAHDNCKCSAVPAFGGQPRPVRPYTPSQRHSEADQARAKAWISKNLYDLPASSWVTRTRSGQCVDFGGTMSEEAAAPEPDQGGENTSETTPDAGGEFEPITSQEELDRRIAKRLERERNKYSDYDELQAKAAQFDELQEANKTEQQKLTERAEKAERDAEAAQLEILRFKFAAESGITENVDLILTASDEETMRKQADLWTAREQDAAQPHSPKPDPNQGRHSTKTASTAEQFASVFANKI